MHATMPPATIVPQVRAVSNRTLATIIPQQPRPGLAYHALKLLGAPKTYTVQPGDCLWTIAEKFYGDGAEWTRIFDANRQIIQTPGLITPGQVLVIPGTSSTPSSAPAPITPSAPTSPAPATATSPPLPSPSPGQGTPWSIFDQPNGQKQAVSYAHALLGKLGAPHSPGIVQVIYDWEVSEGSGGLYNPLNGGDFGGLAISGSQYGGGANNYPSLSVNVTAMAGILENDTGFGYGDVVSALRANDPSAARTAIINSDWAASHYGYGASFSDAPLPV